MPPGGKYCWVKVGSLAYTNSSVTKALTQACIIVGGSVEHTSVIPDSC